jgi:predicted phosphodiesterase
MKVAVFSDVQANLPAMETAMEDILLWEPDLVVMAGDLINRGPSSRDCLTRFDQLRRDRGWLPIAGNHETWVLRCGHHPPSSPVAARMRAFADWTYRQIADIEHALTDWPDHLCFPADGHDNWVHITHGSLIGNRDGITANVPDEALAEKLPADVALFVSAHTHRPLKRQLGHTSIVNVGSVGSPFDGDPRGSYGRLVLRDGHWDAEIRRFDYDRAQAERDFHDSGFFDEGGPLTRILFEEWRRAKVMLPYWMRTFQDAVLAGEIELDQAVDDFLRGID